MFIKTGPGCGHANTQIYDLVKEVFSSLTAALFIGSAVHRNDPNNTAVWKRCESKQVIQKSVDRFRFAAVEIVDKGKEKAMAPLTQSRLDEV